MSRTISLKKMSEVLTNKDFDKVISIVKVEEKGCITPKEVENVCDRSMQLKEGIWEY